MVVTFLSPIPCNRSNLNSGLFLFNQFKPKYIMNTYKIKNIVSSILEEKGNTLDNKELSEIISQQIFRNKDILFSYIEVGWEHELMRGPFGQVCGVISKNASKTYTAYSYLGDSLLGHDFTTFKEARTVLEKSVINRLFSVDHSQ